MRFAIKCGQGWIEPWFYRTDQGVEVRLMPGGSKLNRWIWQNRFIARELVTVLRNDGRKCSLVRIGK